VALPFELDGHAQDDAARLAEAARDEYRQKREQADSIMRAVADGVPVFIVRKFTHGTQQPPEILSAWADEYAAKFEANRWMQDSKIPHDYVTGVLLIGVR
jgi:hypothetical protein